MLAAWAAGAQPDEDTYVAPLADQIDNRPVSIPLLEIAELEFRNLGAAKTAADQDGKDRPVAATFH